LCAVYLDGRLSLDLVPNVSAHASSSLGHDLRLEEVKKKEGGLESGLGLGGKTDVLLEGMANLAVLLGLLDALYTTTPPLL
jgi:hypothetical protein